MTFCIDQLREGDWYDAEAADKACTFFAKRLRHTKAQWAGHPFMLQPWQANDIIRPLFGIKRPDGTRRYRCCDVWVPRKNGKTQLAAGIGLLMMVFDNEHGAEGYAIASNANQARIVYDAAAQMVAADAKLSEVMLPQKQYILHERLNASFRALSGKPTGKHGLNPSFKIGDELHEWPDDRLDQYVRQGMAARRQPLEFNISTAGLRRGHGWDVYQYDKRVAEGAIKDPDRLVVIYEAEPEDDWQDPKVWAKANPNLGVSVQEDYLRAEAQRAAENPRHENDFKRYHLNLWTEQDVRWLPMDKWHGCTARPGDEMHWRALLDEMRGRPCFGGLDLSTTTDVTALTWVFPPAGDDRRIVWLSRYFVPEDRILERVRRDRVPYDKWASAGALELTPGNIIDYEWVLQRVLEDAERFDMHGLAIDRWNDSWITPKLVEELGEERIMRYGQGYASMSSPSKELERLVLGGLIEHGNHPVTTWMASNVAVLSDPAGNIKPVKDKSTDRIDGVVAGIMGLGLAMQNQDLGRSVYETRGILEIEL